MNPIQREEFSNYIRNAFAEYFPPIWEVEALIEKIESVMEFAAENHEQAAVYAVAKEYEYVLRAFFNSDRKAMAVKFVRQVTPATPGLRNAKLVVDHFWAKFEAEQGSDNV